MTEQPFTASNGIVVTIDDKGYLLGTREDGEPGLHATGGPEYGIQALHEYFQHVRDTELGRARWPEDPDYVIYRGEKSDDDEAGRCVSVLHEPSTIAVKVWERWPTEVNNTSEAAARWYFKEGPGKKPESPWENAQVGEVWRLAVDGGTDTFLVKETTFGTPYFFGQVSSLGADSERITAGKKLLEADGSAAGDQ